MRIVTREGLGLVLVDERGEVGWAVRGAIGFRGYASASAAMAAARSAYEAASAHLRRSGWLLRGWPPPGTLATTTREGGRDWIRLDGVPVGLLLQPWSAPRLGAAASFGFEIVVPAELGSNPAVLLLRGVHAALRDAAQSSPPAESEAPADEEAECLELATA